MNSIAISLSIEGQVMIADGQWPIGGSAVRRVTFAFRSDGTKRPDSVILHGCLAGANASLMHLGRAGWDEVPLEVRASILAAWKDLVDSFIETLAILGDPQATKAIGEAENE